MRPLDLIRLFLENFVLGWITVFRTQIEKNLTLPLCPVENNEKNRLN